MLVTKTKVKVIKFFKDTSFTAHLCRQCFEMAILDACWMRSSGYCSSSSISSRRGPYSRTYAICQSPPPDSRRISSGDTTLTLSSSNLNHSSSRGREETSTLNAPLDFHTYASTFCRLSTVGCFTFFPLDPSHIVTRWAGAALVCEHSLQVVVAAVVGTQVCRTHKHSFKLGWWLTRNTKL